jgi:hypothetical protein
MSALPSRQSQPVASAPWRELDATFRGGERAAPADAPLRLRLSVYLTRGRLDRRLANPQSLRADERLALRAGQLTDPVNQRRIARDLRRVIDYADRQRSGAAISAVVIDSPSVRRGRRALAELAEQLERAGAVEPRGVVMAEALLTDGSSPLFNRHADRTVARAVRDIREALDGRPLAAHSAA